MQNASQISLFSCDKQYVTQGVYYVKKGLIVASSRKRPDTRDISILRKDLNADLVYFGNSSALIPSQDRAKALAKVLRQEKDAEEIYFLRGDQLVAVNQSFLSKNKEVVEFVINNSAALFRKRVEVLSVK